MTFQCRDCGYTGNLTELKPIRKPNPSNPDDVVFDSSCPKCASENIDFNYVEDFVVIGGKR